MTARIVRSVLYGALAAWLGACAFAPSRTPLGGNYAIAEPEQERGRHEAASEASSDDSDVQPVPESAKPEPTATVTTTATASVPATDPNLLQYALLKRGDSIKAHVTLSFKGALGGGHAALPGNGELGLDATFDVEIKITQASAQTLDELVLTLTPSSVRTQFGGKSSEMPAGSAKTFEVTLGNAPSVRERGGAKPDAEERAVLMVLVAPLAEFQERWAHSPTLELKPGYAAQVPVSVPAILGRSNDSMHVGPFTARYTGRDANSAGVPFQVALPIEYQTDMGKLSFELSGSARLSDQKARPIAIDLSGPVDGGSGPHQEVEFHGSAKLSARLEYP
jgi:hypothetical protein